MASINKVILVGRVGQDPTVKTFENGGSIVDFSLATSEKYKDRTGKDVENTDWHRVVVNIKGLSDFVSKYVKKGDMLYVEGKIKNEEFTDKTTNTKRSITKIVGLTIQKLNNSNTTTNKPVVSKDELPTVSSKEMNDISNEDDDLPF